MREGVVDLLQQLEGEAEVVLRFGKLWSRRDGLPILSGCGGDFATRQESDSQIVVCFGEIGIQSERTAIFLYGCIGLADLVQYGAQLRMRVGGIRFGPQCFAILSNRGTPLARFILALRPLIVLSKGLAGRRLAPAERRTAKGREHSENLLHGVLQHTTTAR